MPKDTGSEIDELADLVDLYAGYVVDWSEGYTSDKKYEAKRTSTLAAIQAYCDKRIKEAVVAARIEELEMAIAMGGYSMTADGAILKSGGFEGGQPGMVSVSILKHRLKSLKGQD